MILLSSMLFVSLYGLIIWCSIYHYTFVHLWLQNVKQDSSFWKYYLKCWLPYFPQCHFLSSYPTGIQTTKNELSICTTIPIYDVKYLGMIERYLCRLFGFFPLFRQNLRNHSSFWSNVLAIASSVVVFVLCCTVSHLLALGYMLLVFFITMVSPLLFIYAYHYKK